MDPSDLNFPLRSGHSIAGEDGPVDWNNVRTILALMMVFNSKACEDGIKYAEAAGRNTLGAQDYILGLKYNAVPSTGFYNTENLTQKVEEWRNNTVLTDFITGADNSELDGEEEDTEEEFEEDEEWTRAPDSNDFAAKMHAAEEEYEHWQPTTPEGLAVKRGIDKAILKAEEQLLQ